MLLPLAATGEQLDKGIEQPADMGISANLTRNAIADSMLIASSSGGIAASGGCSSSLWPPRWRTSEESRAAIRLTHASDLCARCSCDAGRIRRSREATQFAYGGRAHQDLIQHANAGADTSRYRSRRAYRKRHRPRSGQDQTFANAIRSAFSQS